MIDFLGLLDKEAYMINPLRISYMKYNYFCQEYPIIKEELTGFLSYLMLVVNSDQILSDNGVLKTQLDSPL